MKILVADDHRHIVEGLLLDLKIIKPDATVIGSSDTKEIRRLCTDEKYDVIFMDIDLSGTNGIELAKKILEKHPHTNIIYITGFEEYALESYQTNASTFLLKPITQKKVKYALEHLRFPVSGITEEYLSQLSAGADVLGMRIKKMRIEHGYSTESFAQELNVTLTTVCRWEKGSRVPDTVMLMRIAQVLGIELTDLIPVNGKD